MYHVRMVLIGYQQDQHILHDTSLATAIRAPFFLRAFVRKKYFRQNALEL